MKNFYHTSTKAPRALTSTILLIVLAYKSGCVDTDVMYTWAGPEIAVATTKAYSAQLIALYLLAMKLGKAQHIFPCHARMISGATGNNVQLLDFPQFFVRHIQFFDYDFFPFDSWSQCVASRGRFLCARHHVCGLP